MILKTIDQFFKPAKKIVSLVPSQTELLYHLNLHRQTVGITKFCVHPKNWIRIKTKVGGTKNLHIQTIKRLQPDLIIANKEENVKEQVEELAKEYPVWVTDVNNLQEALKMINDIGVLTGSKQKAEELVYKIENRFSTFSPSFKKLSTAYLIWQKPYMTIGGDSFINNMLTQCGLVNIYADEKRYPKTTIAELKKANCQLLLLSTEPFPFNQKHVDELSRQLPNTKVILVDGEMFSWYGSRLLKAPGYFSTLLKNLSA